MTELKRGDRIKCKDAEDAVDTMCALSREGVQTDFVYKNERGERRKGIWLEVINVERR